MFAKKKESKKAPGQKPFRWTDRVVGPILLACVILYAIPATAVLGAILVTVSYKLIAARAGVHHSGWLCASSSRYARLPKFAHLPK